ncbi:MAG: hypothetical protein D6B26_03505 [Spirochaetaceae bacterium]|nr:MAG: hypothetical protein D6B26_03505 [Spirochaetaceae bacterium]
MPAGKKTISIISIFALLLICGSCATKPAPRWEASLSNEKKSPFSLLYTDEQNRGHWILPLLGSPSLEGEWEKTENGMILHIDKLHLFLNWPEGWSSIEYMAEGVVQWEKTENQLYVASIIEAPQLIGVDKAEIRLRDTRLTGDRAWQEARRRSDRNLEITRLWREHAQPRLFTNARPHYPWHLINPKENFEEFWGRHFFPERYGFKHVYQTEFADAEIISGEDIGCNTAVSQHLLPPEYQALRNSGTLFRDFEEGMEWVYLTWIWDHFFENVLPQLSFVLVE